MNARRLSAREMEVARLVAEDLADKVIADILQISPRTVQRHLDRIAAKIGASESKIARRDTIRRWVEAAESGASQAA